MAVFDPAVFDPAVFDAGAVAASRPLPERTAITVLGDVLTAIASELRTAHALPSLRTRPEDP